MIIARRLQVSDDNPRRQPLYPVQVDWSHPLASGLAAAYMPSQGLRDLSGKGPALSANASTTIVPNRSGIVVPGIGTNHGAQALLSALQRPTTAFSLLWHGVSLGNGITLDAFAIGATFNGTSTASPFDAFSLRVTTTGALFGTTNVGGSTFLSTGNTSAGVWTAGELATYVVTYAVNGSFRLYKNGAQILSVAAGASSIGYGAAPTMGLCFTPYATTRAPNGHALLGGLWNRELSAAEVLWLSGEPFAMFVPELGSRLIHLGPRFGGTTYSDALTEALAGGDAVIAAGTLVGAQSEAIAPADVAAFAAVMQLAGAEGLTTGDAALVAATLGAALSEGVAVADAVSAGSVLSEALALADNRQAVATYILALSEAVIAADGLVAARAGVAALAEVVAATDAVSVPGLAAARRIIQVRIN